MAFVSAAVSRSDELDHECPILPPHVLTTKVIGFAQRGVRDELEAIVLGEHPRSVAEDMPVAATYPGKLLHIGKDNYDDAATIKIETLFGLYIVPLSPPDGSPGSADRR